MDFDLFGEPIDPDAYGPRSAGRPKLKITAEMRKKVKLLAALGSANGWTQENIAAAIGVSRPKLTEYFSDELAAAQRNRLHLKAASEQMLLEKAREGHLGALDRLMKRLDKNPLREKAKVNQIVGKKAGAVEAAKNGKADGKWATRHH